MKSSCMFGGPWNHPANVKFGLCVCFPAKKRVQDQTLSAFSLLPVSEPSKWFRQLFQHELFICCCFKGSFPELYPETTSLTSNCYVLLFKGHFSWSVYTGILALYSNDQWVKLSSSTLLSLQDVRWVTPPLSETELLTSSCNDHLETTATIAALGVSVSG